jgi:Tfp pilus assembly protein PilF
MALVMSGRNAEALAKLREALQIDPNYDEAHYFSGLAYRALKQLDSARQEFEATVQLNPKHARAHGNLGLVLTEQGNFTAAVPQFQIALQLNPQDEIARQMLTRIEQTLTGPRK